MNQFEHKFILPERPNHNQVFRACDWLLAETYRNKSELDKILDETPKEKDIGLAVVSVKIEDLKRIVFLHEDMSKLLPVFLAALGEQEVQS